MGSQLSENRSNHRVRSANWFLLGLLIIFLLLPAAPSSALDHNDPLFQSLAETVTAEAVVGQTVALADFVSKAQAAIDFMRPGGQLQEPRVAGVAQWSPAIANRFAAYLSALYQEDLETLGPQWIAQQLAEWQAADAQVALLSWGVLIEGANHPFESVAVFNPAGDLLFDTLLIRTITGIETQPAIADGVHLASVKASDSKTVSGNYTVKGTFGGTRKLAYEVTLKAEVSPYITAATNDAAMTMTANVSNRSTGTTGLAPTARPEVYFGTGGKFHAINSVAAKTPFKSTIRVSASDVFQDGVYQVSGNDLGSGINFNLSFGVSVKAASVSVSVPGPGPLTLIGSKNASELYLGNVLYSDNAGLRYRGNFRNGGNFKLTNFLIRTGDGTAETGSVSASIPVYMAYTKDLTVLNLTDKPIGTLSPRASYVRGDHIKQPTYTVTADRETVEIGDDVTVTVEIKNNSSAVDIRDGSVALDAGTLNGILTPKSATVVDFKTIGTNRSQLIEFVLTAVESGQVTVQTDVEGRWGSPVPPDVDFTKKASLEEPIKVGDGEGGPGAGETSEAQLESPQQGSFESGISLIRGWVCDANLVEIQIDDREPQPVAYGTNRSDTREICDDVDNGFGFTVNWNNYGDGEHTLKLFVDGEEATRVEFTVTTLGENFLRGAPDNQYTLSNFPETGEDAIVRWSEPHQNFVIMSASSAQSAPDNFQPPAATDQSDALAQLESPQEDSFESGIGLVRGWVCEAGIVEIQIDDRPRREVAYGTNRGDTRQICGDVDNGFGFTVNWSSYGSGEHTLRLYIDGEEFTRANFTVTNLGEDFLKDASGQYTLANFPETGSDVTVRWSEPHQNFVITDYR